MTWLQDLTLDTVIAHTTHGPSIKGLCVAAHDDCLVLRKAMALEDPPVMLNGDVVIPRERLLFMQLVPGAE